MNVAFCRLRGVLNRLFSCNTAPAATVPGLCPGLSLVVAIAGLAAMMLAPRPAALAAGHDLRGAGNANWGQLGIGVTYQTASRIGGADTTVISLSAGASHTVYVDSDGKLWATGYNGKGQLGDGSTTDRETPLQIATDVAQASAGWNHTLFIKTDGSLWGMGDNTYGQLGSASSGVRTTPVLIATDVAKAAAGEYQSIFIKTDGTAWLMDSQINPVHRVPFQVASDVVAISAGSRHVVYIKGDHSLWGIGNGVNGQLGNAASASYYNHVPVLIANDVSSAAAGHSHTLFRKTDGSLWSLGLNEFGELGDGGTTQRATPVQIATDVVEVAAGYRHSVFTKTDGSLWGMGRNSSGELAAAPSVGYNTSPVQIGSNTAGISAGGNHTLYTKPDGSLWGLGNNYNGQLGDPNRTIRPSFVAIRSGVTQISAGSYSSAFLDANGELWATGGGMLGDGLNTNRATPVSIATGVTQVSVGGSHLAFLKTDYSLWTVGENSVGQLGNNSESDRLTPVQVAFGVVQVSASKGGAHTLFIRSDGSLWAVGYNDSGQLGNGTTDNTSWPVQVATNVAYISAGAGHSLFIKTDGTLWGMGANYAGQLGDGSLENRHLPVKIASGVVRVAAGGDHSLFIKHDGSLWATGYNAIGQLGDGTLITRKKPVQIATNVVEVGAGWHHSLFIKSDRSVWGMGYDDYGQLGDGLPRQFRSTPVQVASNGVAVSGGGEHSLVLTGEFHTVTFDLGAHGTRVGGGASVQLASDAPFPPVVTPAAGYVFAGWDTDLNAIETDTVVHALYQRTQTIAFNAPASFALKPGASAALVLGASSSSGLPVTLTVIDGPSLAEDGKTLTFSDTGFVTLRATQEGDATWAPAPAVERRIRASGLSQTITFPPPAELTYGTEPVTLVASASSGLPVTFEVVSGPGFVEDGQLSIARPGSIVIKAIQTGGSGFNAAPPVTRVVRVGKAILTVHAENAARMAGAANPEFTLSYSGFVGAEAEDPYSAIYALDFQPIARTTANHKSPPGTYPITITGGSDDRYIFHPATPGGLLTVRGFSGAYEAWLYYDAYWPMQIPAGKITLTVSHNSLTYSGTLTLADEARPVPFSSTAKNGSSARFYTSIEGQESEAFCKVDTADNTYDLNLRVTTDGTLAGYIYCNNQNFAYLDLGRRVFMPPSGKNAVAWAGRYSFLARPGAGLLEPAEIPIHGNGHAAGSVSSSTGVLTLSGKLPDGLPLTASLKALMMPGETAEDHPSPRYLLWANPYARTRSYFGGALDLQPGDEPPRYSVSQGVFAWKKSEQPVGARKADLNFRDGFGPLSIAVTLDPWLAPSAKPPVATLAQRLGLADAPDLSGDLVIEHGPESLDFGSDNEGLPVAAILSAKGVVTAASNTAAWKITKLDAAKGTFSGSFTLHYTVAAPTGANPDATKTMTKPVTFTGQLRQPTVPDDDLVGAATFTLRSPSETSDQEAPGYLFLRRSDITSE